MKLTMLKAFRSASTLILLSATVQTAYAATFVRWTKGQLADASLESIVEAARAQTGFSLKASDFVLDEERPLAFNRYKRYSQTISGVRVKNGLIRIWTDSQGLIQAEASVENPDAIQNKLTSLWSIITRNSSLQAAANRLSHSEAIALVKQAVGANNDSKVARFSANNYILDGRLVREVLATANYGRYVVIIDILTKKVVSSKYVPFPTSDGAQPHDAHSVHAKVFPVYEAYKGQVLERQIVPLRRLSSRIRRPVADPFEELRAKQRYVDSKYDALQAATPEGRAAGFWSDASLRNDIRDAAKDLPYGLNTFREGLLLQGRYVSVDINPEALRSFPSTNFTPGYSSHAFWSYETTNGNGPSQSEIVPKATYFNKPFASREDLLNTPANLYPDHDPQKYLNEGFDQIQVYYAVDKLFEILHENGWSDPELSTRPFHAVLYDPNIAMRDNAYYTGDTINFTTYTENNLARDNTTIWHELGHGVMDRLMGDFLHLADTGGLSEGMADFVAALVLEGAVGSEDFPGRRDQRIINKTGFFLTNEVHDDGEAYGGTMQDILDASLKTWGQNGLKMMTDLTFETMRLTRDHPNLTAQEWFSHMLYADSLGRPNLREPGQMRGLIEAALVSRNFLTDAKDRGSLSLKFYGNEITAGQPGSRGRAIKLVMDPSDQKEFLLQLKVEDGAQYKFQYPLKLRVFYETGPLQGAIHWDGEEHVYQDIEVGSSGEVHDLPLKFKGTCQFVNQPDGSCVDYVYVHVLQDGSDKAIAKKRFYLQVSPKSAPPSALSSQK